MKWKDLVDFEIVPIESSPIIPVNKSLNEKLHEELTTLRKENEGSEWVFRNLKTGQRLKDIKRAFKGARSRAGIPDLRFHDLRHTFATRLIERGVDLITVKELLGHGSVRMTVRYTHSNRERKRDAVDSLSGERTGNRENPLRIRDMEKVVPIDPSVSRLFSRN